MVRPEALKVLVDRMTDYFDYLLLDTAAGMGDAFLAAASVSGGALLVQTPDPVALRDGRIVSDALYEGGMRQIRLVVNRLTGYSFRGGAVRDLDECIDTVGAQLIAVIPESRQIQQAAAGSTALPEGNLAFTALDRLAQRLEGKRVPLAVPRAGIG